MFSRRQLLIAAAAVAQPGLRTEPSEGAPFSLQLPSLELDPGLQTLAAAITSGFTSCQIQVLDSEGRVRESSRDWGTEPNRPEGAILQGTLPGARPVPCPIRVLLRPTRPRVPSVTVAIQQAETDFGFPARPVRWVAGPADFRDLDFLRQTALRARFRDDPAKPPGGRFEVDIRYDSSLWLRIWAGEHAIGHPVYETTVPKRANGPNALPWDLHSSKGDLVKSGHYLAIISCKPGLPKLHPTVLASYFAVITS